MQNKGLIRFLVWAFALVCLFQLSFTFVTSGIERKAKADFGNTTKIEMPEPVRVYVRDYEYDKKVADHIDAVTGDGTRKKANTDQG